MAGRLIIDTDTAVDDAQAILMAVLSESVDVEALTVVAGNVEFEYQVENSKYALDLGGAEDVPVYEGRTDRFSRSSDTPTTSTARAGSGATSSPTRAFPRPKGTPPTPSSTSPASRQERSLSPASVRSRTSRSRSNANRT